jgi:rare lipoprotein A
MKKLLCNICTVFFTSVFLFACSNINQPSYNVVPHYKVGGPYKIAGKVYKPKIEPDYSEKGMASWYGDEFHNRRTANGEIFHKGDLTAAHRTLPLPSIVKITNLANNKTVIVRVNDRGPFAKGRILDVSEHAAKILGFKNIGTAMVKVEILPNESTAALKTVKIKDEDYAMMKEQYESALIKKTKKTYAKNESLKKSPSSITKNNVSKNNNSSKTFANNRIIAGVYSNQKIAQTQAAKIKNNFSTKIEQIKVDGGGSYRLVISGIKNITQAKAAVAKLKSVGFKNARIE